MQPALNFAFYGTKKWKPFLDQGVVGLENKFLIVLTQKNINIVIIYIFYPLCTEPSSTPHLLDHYPEKYQKPKEISQQF